ncbi:unnamed protein product [Closterium sp. NIES-53]
MYVMTCTRPDLAYPFSLMARYVAPGRHRKVHWDAAKRVLRYLCRTSGMGLVLGGHGSVAMLALCHEQRLEHRTKHIALRYFLARELQQLRQLHLSYVASRANTADVFTLALGSGNHQPATAPTATAATATAATAAATTALACCTAMASLRVLAFDHEGRPIQFDTWLDDLQLYLQSDSKDSVSLFDLALGTAPAPPAIADSATRSQDHFLSLDPTSLTVDLLEQHLLAAKTSTVVVGAARGTPRPPFFEGCSPSPLAPSYASAAAADVSVAEDVGAASASAKQRSSKGKGGRGGGGGSGGGGGGSGSGGGGSSGGSGGSGGGGGGGTGGRSGGTGGGGGGSGGSGSSGGGGTGGGRTGPRHGTHPFLYCPPVSGDSVWLTLRSLPPLVLYELGEYRCPQGCDGHYHHSKGVESVHTRYRASSGSCDCSGVRVRSGSRLLLVSNLIAPDSSVAPPPGSPLPPSPAPPCLSCIEGRQRAAPHSSSFPPTTTPLQTLHMDVWGPARVSGQSRERYFLLVVDDYTRYTTVFPLRSKGKVVDVLIPWIRTVRLQLRERFGQDLPVLCLNSDRGGTSNLLREFCRGEGILQSFTLPDSPQQNGIAERRIGLVMEVARTSMIHVAAPHFLWPFAVRYAAHQLNLCPRVSLPETSPTLRWTGEVGDASVFRFWGSCAFVHDTSTDKLSTHAIPCVFLGFVPDAPGWQFYHPNSRRVLLSQDVTFDESVPFYRLFPYRSAPPPPPPLFLAPGPPPVDPLPPQGPAPSGVSQVDPLPGTAPVQVAVGSGAAPGAASGGAASGGAASGGAEPGGAESEGAGSGGDEPGGAEPEGVEPGGAKSKGAESEGAEPRGAASFGGPAGASPRVSPQQLREWLVRRARLQSGVRGARGAGDAGAGRAGVTVGASGTGGSAAAGPGGARTRGAELPGLVVLGALELETLRSLELLELEALALVELALEALELKELELEALAREALELPEQEVLTLELEVLEALCVRDFPRLHPPPVPGTHAMALRPSCVPLLVPLPAPPESSLPEVPDSESDRARAASPTVNRLLAAAATDPSFESAAASTLVAELLEFTAACRLDYATALVAESASTSPPFVGGFARATAGPLLFLRTDISLPPFYVLVYVNDLVFATADTEALTLVNSELQKRHTCTDLGELRSYLGLQITWDRAQRTITLTKSHMVHQVLQRFGFQFSSPQPTPLSTSHSLSAPPSDESVEPSGPYPELVGCLMYLMTCTRPDLVYPLSLLSRYVAPGRHQKVQWDAARGYCRSSQGYTFSLGSGSVSWLSTRSSSVLSSNSEAEIYAGAMAAQELRWLTYLLTDLGEQPRSPLVLYVDNKAMIALCQEHIIDYKTKHIVLRYFLA